MSYSACIHGGACTGCMECQDDGEIFECADCGEEIDSDDVYDVDGDKLCRHCVLSRFKVPA